MARQLLYIFLTLALFHLLSAAPSVQFVKDSLTLDLTTRDAGEIREWIVETQTDRILLLKIQSESGEQLDQEVVESILTITENRDDGVFTLFPESEPTMTNILPIYSTRNSVLVRVDNNHMNQFQLKIEKAVDCPPSLGGSSSCGRAVDDLSCYCASYIHRSWNDGKSWCLNNSLELLTVETERENIAVWSYFGDFQGFWMGANDLDQEGNFIWEATGELLSNGYTNWAAGEPSNGNGNEDCVYYIRNGQWNDCNCDDRTTIGGCISAFPDNYAMGTLCELQP